MGHEPGPAQDEVARAEGRRRPVGWLWDTWLTWGAGLVTVVGLGLALFNGTVAFGWMHAGVNAAFWHAHAVDVEAHAYQQWVFAVEGATMAGWGVLMTAVARGPFRQRQRWAWTAITSATLTWFVLDTGASIASGVWFNVAINVLVLLVLAPPLIATRNSANADSKDRHGERSNPR